MHRDHNPETIAKLGEFVQPLRELYLTMPKTVGPFLQKLDQASGTGTGPHASPS
jgi:hypothetical protein